MLRLFKWLILFSIDFSFIYCAVVGGKGSTLFFSLNTYDFI